MDFTFLLTEQEANLMLAALVKLPYEAVAGLIDKVNQQAFEQRKATAQPGFDRNVPGSDKAV